MTLMKVTVVNWDDWCGVYFNNDLIDEGHSVNYDTTLKYIVENNIIVHEYENIFSDFTEEDIEETFGSSMPKTYSEYSLRAHKLIQHE